MVVKSKGTPLFTQEKLKQARRTLEDIAFPFTEVAQQFQKLGTPEPFQTYTVAAAESIFQNSADSAEGQSVKSLRRVLTLIDQVTGWIDENLPHHTKVACKPGCDWCCSIPVTVLSIESSSIGAHIQKHWSSHEIEQLHQRCSQFLVNQAKLPEKLQSIVPQKCPLNSGGKCQVYDLRPIMCRIHHSFSAKQCETAFNNWHENPPVKRNSMREVCSQAAIDALTDVLDFHHVSFDSLGLSQALSQQKLS